LSITTIIIDPHYELKHGETMRDELIIRLVHLLQNEPHAADFVRFPFHYFVNELEFEGKLYRLVWLLEYGKNYVGVINAFRRSQ